MSAANIYLACGGSGIKTLKALTEMMSQDPVFRHGFKNDIYYIAVDTDKDELKGLQEHAFALVPGSNEGNIISVQTSANTQSLAPAVREILQKIESLPSGDKSRAEAERRFREHWWHNQDLPFTTDQRLAPQKGAGQCPPVSFFLTWRQLPQISDRIEGVFAEIIKKRGGDLSAEGKRHLPLEDLNVHVVAGLAGGTGRGCWEVLAFKLGEILRKQFGGQLNVKAVLFDSTVTQSVKENKKPETELATKVNAITGISQISLWEQVLAHKQHLSKRLKQVDDKFEDLEDELIYRLPSLDNPADVDSDVLQVHAKPPTDAERRVGEGAEPPASSVCLIFDSNDRAILDSSDDYYQMAGRALYAQLKFSMVGRSVINYKAFYNSIGGASIEVPAAKIQDYLEANSRIAFLENIATQSDLNAVFEKAVAAVRPAAGFGENDGIDKCLPLASARAEDLSLWQRCVKKLLDDRATTWSDLEADLIKGQNLETLLEDLQTYASVSDEQVNAAVAETLGSLGPSGLDVLRPYLEAIYYRDVVPAERLSKRQRNLRGVAAFCEQFDNAIRAAVASLPDKVRFGEDRTIETVFEEAKGRPMLIAGRRFADEEITELRQAADLQLLRNAYPQLKKAFGESVASFFGQAAVVKANAESILGICEEVKKDVGKRLAKEWKVGDGNFEKCFGEVFSDPTNPAKGLDHEDAQRFYKRLLKPALAVEEVRSLCVDDNSLNIGGEHAVQAVDALLYENALSDAFAQGAGRDKIGFAKALDADLKRAVTIKSDLVKERFNLLQSLDTIRRAWASYLPKVRHDNDDLERALHIFQSLFGRRAEEKMGEFDIGSTDELLKDMTASLASTTTAYWKLGDSMSSQRSVYVFLPKLGGEFQRDEWDKYLAEKMPQGVEPSVDQGREGEANPFAVVAFAIESTNKATPDNPHGSLDNILSLNYWRETSVVRHLQRAEERSGANALFNPLLTGMNGSSFHDPVYVEKEVYASLRWRPWYERKASAAAADEAEDGALRALVYMFFQPVGEIGKIAESKGWKFPLAQFDDSGTLKLSRNGLEFRPDGRILEDSSKIEAGKLVGNKPRECINGAKAWLSSDAGRETLKSILAERDSFWTMLDSTEGINRKKKQFSEFCDELYKIFSQLREGSGSQDKADKELWNDMVRALQDRNPNLV
jgi:hypothetical protein